jgi:putative ABC transport system permease protein
MAMTARERLAEYATLKALGFGPGFVAALIVGESMLLTAMGGALGIVLTFPAASVFKMAVGTMFPIFTVTGETIAMQAVAALLVGALAALVPSIRASRVKIVDGLRYIG